ncbi:MAG: gamma-glutamylcyclotransferase [Nitrospira sp.]|nr:gamma-glutamylcyclotransferase [Nitrospira sp.]
MDVGAFHAHLAAGYFEVRIILSLSGDDVEFPAVPGTLNDGIVPSPGEKVWGGVFEVTDEDLKLMDEFEQDVPQGAYRHLQITVLNEAGSKELVTTYAANPIGKFKAKDHYLDWVMKGLSQWKLPQEAVQQWESYRPR